jgi:hypothetical protein
MGRSPGGLTSKFHAVVGTNVLRTTVGLQANLYPD